MAVKISVIVPSLGRMGQLRDCLSSTLRQDSSYDLEIITVIDGDEAEESARILESEFGARASMVFDASPKRRGSPAAKNIGARKSNGEILVFLDDDTRPSLGWLKSLVESYSEEVVGVGGSELKSSGVPLSSKLVYLLYGNSTGKITLGGRVVSNFTPEKKEAESVDCLAGCNMSFRRDAFLKSGGFDENYGGNAYREETDLCVRIRSHGELIFAPSAVVEHREDPHGGNTPSSLREWNYWYHRNNTYFFLKNFRSGSALRWWIHLLGEVMFAVGRTFALRDVSPLTTLREGITDGKTLFCESRGQKTNG